MEIGVMMVFGVSKYSEYGKNLNFVVKIFYVCLEMWKVDS